jgi:hypothetical protein
MKPFRIHLKFTKEFTRNKHIKMLHITCVLQRVNAFTKILAMFFFKVQQLMGLQGLEPKLEFEGAKDEQNLEKIQLGNQWSKYYVYILLSSC